MPQLSLSVTDLTEPVLKSRTVRAKRCLLHQVLACLDGYTVYTISVPNWLSVWLYLNQKDP
jgi:hypothetical protein